MSYFYVSGRVFASGASSQLVPRRCLSVFVLHVRFFVSCTTTVFATLNTLGRVYQEYRTIFHIYRVQRYHHQNMIKRLSHANTPHSSITKAKTAHCNALYTPALGVCFSLHGEETQGRRSLFPHTVYSPDHENKRRRIVVTPFFLRFS